MRDADPRCGRKLFLWQRHGVRGDALPFAVPLHPRIGEPVGVRESFAGLRLAGLFRDAGHDRDVRAEHAHAHVARNGGRISACVALRFGEQRCFVAGLAARRSPDEIIGHDFLDRRCVVCCK